jgi:hypothetical protein
MSTALSLSHIACTFQFLIQSIDQPDAEKSSNATCREDFSVRRLPLSGSPARALAGLCLAHAQAMPLRPHSGSKRQIARGSLCLRARGPRPVLSHSERVRPGCARSGDRVVTRSGDRVVIKEAAWTSRTGEGAAWTSRAGEDGGVRNISPPTRFA